MPVDMVRDIMACTVTLGTCKGALGTWQLQEYPDMLGRGTMERPRKQTREYRGVCESALKLCARWEGDQREAKVRTGLGKAHCPGSQGGLRKRGPGWNEAPTSRIERASAGNSPPKVVRAADLSRPPDMHALYKNGLLIK
jgi:hypothetical protein